MKERFDMTWHDRHAQSDCGRDQGHIKNRLFSKKPSYKCCYLNILFRNHGWQGFPFAEATISLSLAAVFLCEWENEL